MLMTNPNTDHAERLSTLQRIREQRIAAVMEAVEPLPEEWKPYATAWLTIGFRLLDAFEMPLMMAESTKPTAEGLGGDETEFGDWMLQGTRHDRTKRGR
jgi:hypothetical protein